MRSAQDKIGALSRFIARSFECPWTKLAADQAAGLPVT
jgi:hypothetical protein